MPIFVLVPTDAWPDRNTVSKCMNHTCGKSFGMLVSKQQCNGCGRVCCGACLNTMCTIPRSHTVAAKAVCTTCAELIQMDMDESGSAAARSSELSAVVHEQELKMKALEAKSKSMRLENEASLAERHSLEEVLQKTKTKLLATERDLEIVKLTAAATPREDSDNQTLKNDEAYQKRKSQLDTREASLNEMRKKMSTDAQKLNSQRETLRREESAYKQILLARFDETIEAEIVRLYQFHEKQVLDTQAKFGSAFMELLETTITNTSTSDQLTNLQATHADQTNQINLLTAELLAHTETHASQLTALKQEHATEKQKLSANQGDTETAAREATATIEKLRKEIDDLREEHATEKQKLSANQGDAETAAREAAATIEKLRKEIDDLREEHATEKQKLSANQGDAETAAREAAATIEKLRKEIDDLREEHATEKQKLSANQGDAETAAREATATIEELKCCLAESESARKAEGDVFRSDIASLIGALEKVRSEQTVLVEELTGKLSDAEVQIGKVVCENQSLMALRETGVEVRGFSGDESGAGRRWGRSSLVRELNLDGDIVADIELPAEIELREWSVDILGLDDVVRDATRSGGILVAVAMRVYEMWGLDSIVCRKRFNHFLCAVEEGYGTDNPYHNASHAADVLHSVFSMLCHAMNDFGEISSFEKLVVVISAVVHDFRHPGVSNVFLSHRLDAVAVRYNHISVLEQFHVAAAFQLMGHEELDITEGMDDVKALKFHSSVAKLVGGTDMSLHMKEVACWKQRGRSPATEGGYDLKNSEADRLEVFTMVLHAADIGVSSKSVSIAEKWVDRVMKEFKAQGKEELRLGFPLSFNCDPAPTKNDVLWKSQLGFLDTFVIPLFQVVGLVLPDAVTTALTGLSNIRAHYAEKLGIASIGIRPLAQEDVPVSKSDFNALKDEVDETRIIVREKDEELQKVTTELAEARASHEKILAQKTTENQRTKSEVKSMQEKMAALKLDASSSKEEVRKLRESGESLIKEVSELEVKLRTVQKNADKWKKKSDTVSAEMELTRGRFAAEKEATRETHNKSVAEEVAKHMKWLRRVASSFATSTLPYLVEKEEFFMKNLTFCSELVATRQKALGSNAESLRRVHDTLADRYKMMESKSKQDESREERLAAKELELRTLKRSLKTTASNLRELSRQLTEQSKLQQRQQSQQRSSGRLLHQSGYSRGSNKVVGCGGVRSSSHPSSCSNEGATVVCSSSNNINGGSELISFETACRVVLKHLLSDEDSGGHNDNKLQKVKKTSGRQTRVGSNEALLTVVGDDDDDDIGDTNINEKMPMMSSDMTIRDLQLVLQELNSTPGAIVE